MKLFIFSLCCFFQLLLRIVLTKYVRVDATWLRIIYNSYRLIERHSDDTILGRQPEFPATGRFYRSYSACEGLRDIKSLCSCWSRITTDAAVISFQRASEGMKSSSLKHLGLFSSPFLVSLRAALEGVTVQLEETINGLIAAWVVRMLRPRLALNGINTVWLQWPYCEIYWFCLCTSGVSLSVHLWDNFHSLFLPFYWSNVKDIVQLSYRRFYTTCVWHNY